MSNVTSALARLFAIRPGEEPKTFLLYSLHFAFYLGLNWGANACLALFLHAWEAEYLGVMFVGDALLILVLGVLYTFLANRFNNQQLLLIILSAMIAWLVSVWWLLGQPAYTGQHGLVYPYFYLGYDAFRDIAALHILTYINDFYDTRAAKRALPLMLSANLVGAIVAGFSGSLLNQLITLENVPLAWVVCLLVAAALVFVVQRRLAPELTQLRQTKKSGAALASQNNLEKLRAGFQFVRDTSILRWLALLSLVMIILVNLLLYQSSSVLQASLKNDSDQLFNVYALFTAVSSAIALPLQVFVLGRLIASFGVGTVSLIFPALTLATVVALNFFPNFTTAIFTELNRNLFRKSFQSPLEAMLYNSVPLQIKTQARGFVTGLIVPFGILAAGLIVQSLKGNQIPAVVFIGFSLGLGVAYIAIAIRVRAEYSLSLAKLLADDEVTIFRLGQSGFEQPDPATINFLYRRLNEAHNDEITIFLAEVLYELQEQEAFNRLEELASHRGPTVHASIIQMLGSDWIDNPSVRNLCLRGVKNEDVNVRQASTSALVHVPEVSHDKALLEVLLGLLRDPDETIQAEVIPPLIASGRAEFATPARERLTHWLNSNTQQRTLGLRVLAKSGDERLTETLQTYFKDPAPDVRLQAVELINALLARTTSEAVKHMGLQALQGLLGDVNEIVRLAAVNGLGQIQTLAASQALLTALNDESFEVRKQACALMNPVPKAELEVMLASSEIYHAECAAVILAPTDAAQSKRRALELMDALVSEAYGLNAQRLPMNLLNLPGAYLMERTFHEHSVSLLERVFWLLSIFCGEQDAQSIRRSLEGTDPINHANAAEALESLTSPQAAQLLIPLLQNTELAKLTQIGQTRLSQAILTVKHILHRAWPQLALKNSSGATRQSVGAFYQDGWLKAVAIYAVLEMRRAGRDDLWPGDATMEAALKATLADDSFLARETAQYALVALKGSSSANPPLAEGKPMLTTIEKVIFLKEVPFFHSMTISQLRILASISDVATFAENQAIFREGEYGDTLYVVISGQVAIQRQPKGRRRTSSVTRLATLGPREYFAEMSIFDNEPHEADAIAQKPTELLLVRQAPLIALIKNQPDLALGLFKVLSQRLRQANTTIADKTQAKPKELLDLYDKF